MGTAHGARQHPARRDARPAARGEARAPCTRTHTQEGTLAGSLLSHAIDEADVDARHAVDLLDGIPGAFERAQLGREQARSAQTIALDDL
jgi:hypothetical protein